MKMLARMSFVFLLVAVVFSSGMLWQGIQDRNYMRDISDLQEQMVLLRANIALRTDGHNIRLDRLDNGELVVVYLEVK